MLHERSTIEQAIFPRGPIESDDNNAEIDASVFDLLATYAGQASDLAAWLKDADLNLDRNLRLQYLAGLGLNLYQAGPIYAEILQHRGEPGDLFVGSEQTLQALRSMIANPPLR